MSSTPSLKYSKRIAALGAASAAVLSLGTASAAVTTIDANVILGSTSGDYAFNFVPTGSSYVVDPVWPYSLPGYVSSCYLYLGSTSSDLMWSPLLAEGSVIDGTLSYLQNRMITTVPADGETVHAGYRYSDTVNGRDYFGYVTVTGVGSDSFTVDSYTYESTPNTSISIAAVPEPSAALLAFAGAGLFFRRRRAN